MTVTVVSTTSDGGEVNESRVGNTRGESPDGWGERDGFFNYFKRRRHLVAGVGGRGRERGWLAVVNSGTVRRMSITRMSIQSLREGITLDLFYRLSLIRLPSVLRILRRRVLRRVQVPHPKIFPIVAFHKSPASTLAIRSQSGPQHTRTGSCDSQDNPFRGPCTA